MSHIKTIVSRQQEHTVGPAGGSHLVLESLPPEKVAEEAIALVKRSCETEGIVFERRYQPTPSVAIDRHKTLQIIVNLLNNARQALGHCDGKRKIEVVVRPHQQGHFAIESEDNGCGIETENVGRLFHPGFSTKADGHGLGLHSSACMAQEIGGSLTGRSDGPGRGARFTLVLPLRPAA